MMIPTVETAHATRHYIIVIKRITIDSQLIVL